MRRELGGVLALTVATGLLSAGYAALLILVPLAALLIALPPRRTVLVATAAACAVLLLRGPVGDPVADFGRGWSLVLAGWLVVGTIAIRSKSFLPLGLVAVTGATATVAVFFVLNPGSFTELDAAFRARLEQGIEAFSALRGSDAQRTAEALQRSVAVQSALQPAMLAVASLAAVAVAWWMHRRLVARVERPLGSLREFRFSDGLVWLLILGVTLAVVPLGPQLVRAGTNLATFAGALYAVRGLAVMLFLVDGLGPVMVALAAVMAVLLYPVTFVVGLTDMWLDLRTRRRADAPPGG